MKHPTMIALSLLCLMPNAAFAGSIQINNNVSGPGRFELSVENGGGTNFAAVFPIPSVTSNYDLVDGFIPFLQLGAVGGAVELFRSSDSIVFIAQTQTVRSTGTVSGPNGPISWVSEARLSGPQRFENKITFSSTAPFGAVRFINLLDGSVIDRAGLIDPGTPNFNLQYYTEDQSVSTSGISHGIAQSTLVNASYAGWVMRDFSPLFSNIISSTREVFSVSGILDNILVTTSDPRLPAITAYKIFESPSDPSSAFAVDLNAAATSATVVTYLTASPVVQLDAIFKNGFE